MQLRLRFFCLASILPQKGFYLRRRFLVDFFDPVFDFAGIFKVFPARSLSLVMPFALLSSAMLTPYFLEILLRLSPFFILCTFAAGAFALVLLFAAAACTDFLEDEAGASDCHVRSPPAGTSVASAVSSSASPSPEAVLIRKSCPVLTAFLRRLFHDLICSGATL